MASLTGSSRAVDLGAQRVVAVLVAGAVAVVLYFVLPIITSGWTGITPTQKRERGDLNIQSCKGFRRKTIESGTVLTLMHWLIRQRHLRSRKEAVSDSCLPR